MNVFEAIVIIAVISIIASVIKNKHNNAAHSHRPDDSADHSPDNSADTEQMQAQIQDLKKRVETLEAIVTDKAYNLKKEIDDL